MTDQTNLRDQFRSLDDRQRFELQGRAREALIALYEDPAQAVVDLARDAKVSVHYLTRDSFENVAGRLLSETEWADLFTAYGEDFDEFMDNGTDDTQQVFIWNCLKKAGIVRDEAEV